MSSKEQEKPFEIELTDEIAEGIYSNMAFIAHSHSEFVIDFISLLPGLPKAKVKSRILIAPEHAKRLLLALNDNINKYENNFGEISIDTDSKPTSDMSLEQIGQA